MFLIFDNGRRGGGWTIESHFANLWPLDSDRSSVFQSLSLSLFPRKIAAVSGCTSTISAERVLRHRFKLRNRSQRTTGRRQCTAASVSFFARSPDCCATLFFLLFFLPAMQLACMQFDRGHAGGRVNHECSSLGRRLTSDNLFGRQGKKCNLIGWTAIDGLQTTYNRQRLLS